MPVPAGVRTAFGAFGGKDRTTASSAPTARDELPSPLPERGRPPRRLGRDSLRPSLPDQRGELDLDLGGMVALQRGERGRQCRGGLLRQPQRVAQAAGLLTALPIGRPRRQDRKRLHVPLPLEPLKLRVQLRHVIMESQHYVELVVRCAPIARCARLVLDAFELGDERCIALPYVGLLALYGPRGRLRRLIGLAELWQQRAGRRRSGRELERRLLRRLCGGLWRPWTGTPAGVPSRTPRRLR
jgi:hypothetical protein